jgi:WD40 repeat protein
MNFLDSKAIGRLRQCTLGYSWQLFLFAAIFSKVAFSQPTNSPSRPEMALQFSRGLGSITSAPDGRTLLNYLYSEGYEIWDLQTGQIRYSVLNLNLKEMPKFSLDGKLVVCIRVNGEVQVRDAESGKMRRSLKGFEPEDEIATNGSMIVGYKGDRIQIFSVRNGQLLRSLQQEPGDYFFSPDGKLLAVLNQVLYEVGTVRIWDIATGKLVSSTTGFSARQLDKGARLSLDSPRGARLDADGGVVFAPDGKTFATSGVDPKWTEPKGFWGDEGYPIDYVLKI